MTHLWNAVWTWVFQSPLHYLILGLVFAILFFVITSFLMKMVTLRIISWSVVVLFVWPLGIPVGGLVVIIFIGLVLFTDEFDDVVDEPLCSCFQRNVAKGD